MEHNIVKEKEDIHQLDSNSFISEKEKINDYIPLVSIDKIRKRQICEADVVCKIITDKIIELAFIKFRMKSIYEETPNHCFNFTKNLLNTLLIEDNIFTDKENDKKVNTKNNNLICYEAPQLDFELELYGKNKWSKRFQPVIIYLILYYNLYLYLKFLGSTKN